MAIMIEIVVMIAIVALMMKIAEIEGLSTIIWGVVTFGICLLCLQIPLPYFRMLVGLGMSFVGMTLYNASRQAS